ncbi:PIN domain-containing protein [Spongiibacter tropicus]|jgi:PIN domain-containing protein|uniref:PIN domain-containing protein n=1 Tax=Spongiibacter tropicus TaxID=454602 RepID=UPI00115EA47E|nr:PIN domain-containing protein [Spongiibacter tropicus]SMO74956.1 hypothetical protein SAMN06272769_111128 [Alcanivorax sp. DSM 26295]|tara:strand:- start:148 stop:1056 length:909 start_codon:yes stop_codon:yes gene_type:complete
MNMDTVLFIDANIWLDFYRIRKDAQKSLLDHLESQSELIVTTNQIEMEYKKHRQFEMVGSIREMKPPGKMPIPPLVAQHQSAEAYKNAIKSVSDKVSKLKRSMENAFETPYRYDDVYKVAQRVFHNFNSPLNLHRETECKRTIRRLAFRRFIMGYPPRKKNDTSIGDAINWEWIVHVCKEQNANAIIVSRDGDYGVSYNDKSYINDWLSSEFKERVNKRKTVTLYDSLSSALKELRVRVTQAEEDEERRMIKRRERGQRAKFISGLSGPDVALLEVFYGDDWKEIVTLEELKSLFPSDVEDG